MATTPKLKIPEISESQASKYVTNNQAWRIGDALIQAVVIDRDLIVPPGGPSDGNMYIVGSPTDSTSGDWEGHDYELAYYENTAWAFHTPAEGWLVYAQDENELLVYQSESEGWEKLSIVQTMDFKDLDDTPLNYTGNAYEIPRVNSTEDGLEFIENSFDIGASYVGQPTASLVLIRIPLTRTVTFPDDLAGSQGVVAVAPAAQADFDIKKNGVSFGTMTFAGAATTATFTTASGAASFAAGDVLTIEAPSSQDANLSDPGFLLKGAQE